MTGKNKIVQRLTGRWISIIIGLGYGYFLFQYLHTHWFGLLILFVKAPSCPNAILVFPGILIKQVFEPFYKEEYTNNQMTV